MARARRALWARRVEQWLESGQTAREFAATAGINANTLANWRYKLKREAARASSIDRERMPVQFVELVNTQPEQQEQDERLEIVLGGATVRVPARFDVESLRRVLAVIEAR
jgi:transposase-like protein